MAYRPVNYCSCGNLLASEAGGLGFDSNKNLIGRTIHSCLKRMIINLSFTKKAAPTVLSI